MAAWLRQSTKPGFWFVLGTAVVVVVAQFSKYWNFEDAVTQPFRPAVGAAVAVSLLAPVPHRTLLAAASMVTGRAVCLALWEGDVNRQVVSELVGDGLMAALGVFLASYALRRMVAAEWILCVIAVSALGTAITMAIAGTGACWTFFWQRAAAIGLGLYVIPPLPLLPRSAPLVARSTRERLEFVVAALCLVVITAFAFSEHRAALYLVPAVLLWLCARSGPRYGIPAALGVGIWACISTSLGIGPFALTNQVAQTQAFLAVIFLSAAIIVNAEEASTLRSLSLAEQIRRRHESEDRWHRIGEAAQEGVLECDAASYITFANKRLADIVGRDQHELIGLHVMQIIGDQRWREIAGWRPNIEAGQPATLEMALDTPHGPGWGFISISPRLDSLGEYEGSTILVTDITSIKAAETERINLVDELASVEHSEQVRLARDLHDGPLQDLTAVHLMLGHLANEQPDETMVTRASAAMTDALAALRSGMNALDPPDVVSGGLAQALERHGRRVVGASDVDFSVQENGRMPIGPGALVLYRIAREAITNAARHADPSTISVSVGTIGVSYQLIVKDDGVGFTPGPDSLVGHMGLRSMRARAQEANAELDLESSELGTTVIVTLPIRQGKPQRRAADRSTPRSP